MEAFVLAGLVALGIAVMVAVKFPSDKKGYAAKLVEQRSEDSPLVLTPEEIFLRTRTIDELEDMDRSLLRSGNKHRSVSIQSLSNFNETKAEAHASAIAARKADELEIRRGFVQLELSRRGLYERLSKAKRNDVAPLA
jgi:hypothetical protein